VGGAGGWKQEYWIQLPHSPPSSSCTA